MYIHSAPPLIRYLFGIQQCFHGLFSPIPSPYHHPEHVQYRVFDKEKGPVMGETSDIKTGEIVEVRLLEQWKHIG